MRFLRPLAWFWMVVLGGTWLVLLTGLVLRLSLPSLTGLDAPRLLETIPASDSDNVLPRSELVFRFDRPMNRDATRAALSIRPQTPGEFRWDASARTLTFRPANTLVPNVTYTLEFTGGALGRWWRPLESVAPIRFRTAAIPTVIGAYPNDRAVDGRSAIALVFSQPMIPAEQIGQPTTLAELSFEPSFARIDTWASATTLIVQPQEPLTPATRYRGRLDATLTDLRGADLGQPFVWSFATAWPRLLANTPADGAQYVSPRAPLTFTLDQALDLTQLQASLSISPTIERDIATLTLPDSTQLVTVTPRLGWDVGRLYRVSFRPLDGSAPSEFSFTSADRPALVGRFPGPGQLLPVDQPIRLLFSTPMDAETLRAGLSFSPPVDDLRLTVNETEVRVTAALRPSTAYTLTIIAATSDRNGEVLPDAYDIPLTTAALGPTVSVPQAIEQVIALPTTTTAITIAHAGISTLDLALYPLDQTTLLRTLNLNIDDWPDFQPERYNLNVLRRWSMPLSAAADLTQTSLSLTADATPLPPGAYYLRGSASANVRLDLVIFVTSYRLVFLQHPESVLIWATDNQTGQPIADLPLSLYQGSSLVGIGTTDAAGLWRFAHRQRSTPTPYLVLASAPQTAAVKSSWASADVAAQLRDRALVFTDRNAYRAGDMIRLSGLARRFDATGQLALATANTPCRMQIVRRSNPASLRNSAACQLDAAGFVDGSLPIDPMLPVDEYLLRVELGSAVSLLPFRVLSSETPFIIELPAPDDDALNGRITGQDLPLANATLSWTLHLIPRLAPPVINDMRFATASTALTQTLSGTTRSAADGSFSIPLPPQSALTSPVDALLRVETTDAALATATSTAFTRFPLEPRIGLRLVEPFVEPDSIPQVEVLALNGADQPLPNATVTVDIFVRGATRSAPLLTRRVITDAAGSATASFVRLRPGTYDVVARLDAASVTAQLYAVAPGFAAWPDTSPALTLVPDKPRYRPGEEARILVASPFPTATLLLATQYGSTLDGSLRSLRAGEIITVTVTEAMAPVLMIEAVATAPGTARFGSVQLRVEQTPTLTATLRAASGPFTPGASVPLTLTLNSTRPVSSAEALAIVLPATSDTVLDFAAPPAPLRRARSALPSEIATAPPSTASEPVSIADITGAGPPQRISSNGDLNASIILPASAGEWRIALLIGADAQLTTAETTLRSEQALALTPLVPAGLRKGDSAQVSLLVQNLTPQTRTLQLALSSVGATLATGEPTRQSLVLAANSTATVEWRIVPAGDQTIMLRFEVDDDRGRREERVAGLALLPDLLPSQAFSTISARPPFTTTLTLPPELAGVAMDLVFAPDVYAAVLSAEQALAAEPARTVEQEASLLLLRAALAQAGGGDGRAIWSTAAAGNIEALRAAQQRDVAWGWWQDTPVQPFVTGYVLEAFAAARDELGIEVPAIERSLAWLRDAAASSDPDLRAYLTYVHSRYVPVDRAAVAALLEEDLQAESLAYLALALPRDEAAALRVPLNSKVRRGSGGAYWESTVTTAVPYSRLSTTALVVGALGRVAPSDELRTSALAVLRRGWLGTGWPTSYDSARVATSLLADWRGPSAAARLALAGQSLLNADTPITTTSRISLSAAQLASEPVLRIDTVAGTPDAEFLLASLPAAPAPLPEAPPVSNQVFMLTYADPSTGRLIDRDDLRVGQFVEVRATLVTVRPLLLPALDVPLPGGLLLLDTAATAPFIRVERDDPSALRYLANALEPGVYTQRYLARVGQPGIYRNAPLRLTPLFEPANAILSPDFGRIIVNAP